MGEIKRWLGIEGVPDQLDRPALPAIRSRYELRLLEAAALGASAIEQVAEMTKQIAEINPSDTETYDLLLEIRATYVEATKKFMQDLLKYGGWTHG